MSVQAMHHGFHLATGGPDNIQVGFIPDVVELYSVGRAVPVINVWIRMKFCAFTSGGTYEVKAGDTLQGATAVGVRAEVQKVYLTSGTWAGGDAAGYFLWQDFNQNGSFGSENVDVLSEGGSLSGGGVGTANVATVAAQTELGNFVLAGNATPASTSYTVVTPANGIQPYSGTDGANSEGFTITATLATAGEIWFWRATRGTITL